MRIANTLHIGDDSVQQVVAAGNGLRQRLNDLLLRQLEELITNYGPLFEIWFDGGILRPEKGGPDIPGLLKRIAPNLICFGGCPGITNVLRWSGSEQAPTSSPSPAGC